MDNNSDTHVRLKNIYNFLSKKIVWIFRYILIGVAMIYEMMPGTIYTVFPCLKKMSKLYLSMKKEYCYLRREMLLRLLQYCGLLQRL